MDRSIWTNQRGLNVTAPQIGPFRSGYGVTSPRPGRIKWAVSPTRRFGEVFSVLEFYSLQGVL